MVAHGPKSLSDISPTVIEAQDTWSTITNVPFFDERVIVEASAQFVNASFDVGNAATLLHALSSPAHFHAGADRFALELVPRCSPLREQLLQTVRPICMDGAAHKSRDYLNASIEYEVDRFLRARLVTCDLCRLLTYDCYTRLEDRPDPEGSSDDSDAEAIDCFASAAACREHDSKRSKACLEYALTRFEHHFWLTLVRGLALSLFGHAHQDLVDRFQARADETFDHYNGELQLAMNSLMGWLPSQVSGSLFIAFVGVHTGAAYQYAAEKYKMLYQCLKTLCQLKGRYIYVSTPEWYFPLVTSLPALGHRESMRPGLRLPNLRVRSVWLAACFGLHDCVRPCGCRPRLLLPGVAVPAPDPGIAAAAHPHYSPAAASSM